MTLKRFSSLVFYISEQEHITLITTLVKQFELQQWEKWYLIRSHCILSEVVLITAYPKCKKARWVVGKGQESFAPPGTGPPTARIAFCDTILG